MTISPWVFLSLMTCPMDPRKLHSRAMILHKEMWVTQTEAFGVESKYIELFYLGIRMLEISYLVQPNSQRKSGSGCLLLSMQSS